TASAPMACRVSAVSLRDSPVDRLEPFAEKLMTSAERRLAAASKLIRVRVESSKKRFTTVAPTRVGSLRSERDWVSAMCSAVASTDTASSRLRSPIEMKCLMPAPLTDRGGPHDVDRILAVRLGELDVHALGAGGGEVLAHVVRPDGQLPVAAVHEHREPHRGGASDRAERVESGTD